MAGIYVHVPFCKAKCRYCDFTSYPNKLGISDAYMACVLKEMEYRSKDLQNKSFDTVYFGGGTPSIISEKWIVGCMNQIRKRFHLAENSEVTIEMNPGTVDKEKIQIYKHAGVNRFSVGLQAAQDSILSNLGRIHSVRDYVSACELLKNENFNTDIMIGLKGQRSEDLIETINLASKCGSSHISMYALTPEEGTPIFTEEYLNGDLPDGDEVAAFYDAGKNRLNELGYTRYEVSNFAKDGFESKHNLNYWKRGEYIAFGAAGSSFMCGRRFTNTRDLDEYMKCILSGHYAVIDDEQIEGNDAKFEMVMLAFRTQKGLDINAYKNEFNSEFVVDFFEPLNKNKKYLDFDGKFVRIKDEYLYVQNKIICDFLS